MYWYFLVHFFRYLLIVGVTAILIMLTPIKEYVPGYASSSLEKSKLQIWFIKLIHLEQKLAD